LTSFVTSQVMAALPTLYKAAHAFLVSRKPLAVDSGTAVPLHALLRALRSPLCAGAQWATHPGLRSVAILLKFLKTDTALSIGAAEGDKADCTPLYINKFHNSYRTALKAYDGFGAAAANSTGIALWLLLSLLACCCVLAELGAEQHCEVHLYHKTLH
jgi:hypothetical protein